MRLEQIAIVLRRRNAWEALDLGHTLMRAWAAPGYRAWFATYWLIGIPILLLLWPWQSIALTVLWWLKPAFDRVLLFVYSRSLFGTSTNVRDVWRALPALLKSPGLLSALTIRRFSLQRSFLLPVWQLEQQRGKDARARFKVLARRTGGNAVWLTFVCANMVSVIGISLMLLVEVLMPRGQEAFFFNNGFFNDDFPHAKHFLANLLFMIGETVVEPLYVSSGFALYLNRRSELEGWDIELALRRLAARLRSGTAALVRSLAVLAIAAGIGLFAATLPDAAWAETAKAESRPKQVVKEVLADPVFGKEIEEMRWQARTKEGKRQPPPEWMKPFLAFFEFMSQVMRGLVWVGALLLVAVLIYLVMRYREAWFRGNRDAPPDFLFGLDVRPGSLPADVVAAARAALAAGRVDEALSLLYRGSLVALIHRWQVDFRAGDTEDDCLRRTRGAIGGNAHRYFDELFAAWRATAYAHMPPATAAIENLCAAWNEHFGSRPDNAEAST